MKKILAILLSLALIFTLAACGNNDGEVNNGETDEGQETEETEQTPTNTAETIINGLTGTTYELILDSVSSVPVDEGITKFKDLVEEYSSGTITLKQKSDNGEADAVERLQKTIDGETDICIGTADGFAKVIKDLHLFDVYYLFRSSDEIYDVALDSDLIEDLEAAFEEEGLKCLSLWGNGFRELTTNKKKVKKVSGLKGLKIATTKGSVNKAAWKALGAKPVYMDLGERAEAISKGEIAGQECDMEALVNNDFQSTEKYCIMTDHAYSPYVVVMNLEKFNSLSEVQQNAITEAMAYAGKYQLDRCELYMDYIEGVIEKSQIEVITLTDKSKASFIKKTYKKTKEKAKKLMDDPWIVDSIEKKLETYRKANADKDD